MRNIKSMSGPGIRSVRGIRSVWEIGSVCVTSDQCEIGSLAVCGTRSVHASALEWRQLVTRVEDEK